MTAGNANEPYTKKINITLLGKRNSPFLITDDQGIIASNKVIYNKGNLKFYGTVP